MKVLFDIAHSQIAIEGDGPDLISVLQLARELAPKLTEIRLVTSPNQPPSRAATAPIRDIQPKEEAHQEKEQNLPAKQGVPTLREFVKQISPETVAERIIAIGVYHARHHGQDIFTPKQMAEWFSHSGFQKPAQMPVALFAAKKRYGYLENPAHGRWKVSVAGENAITRKIEENGDAKNEAGH